MLATLTQSVVSLLRRTPDAHLPRQVFKDDVFIVSYPKSGNTWARFLLANLLRPRDTTIDFHNVSRFVPEVGRHEDILDQLPRPRLIKSHAPRQRRYPRTVLIVRDGRDVYSSYFHHLHKSLPEGTTFGEFLRREDHSPCLWGQHTGAWLDQARQASRVLRVRYEDLKSDTLGELTRMAEWIGLDTTPSGLRGAVEAASFENMRRIEDERGRPYKATGPERFVRKGEVGDWVHHFSDEDRAFFKQREGRWLIELGYEKDTNW